MSERDEARELLRRLREWDALNPPTVAPYADAPYWISEIDRVLAAPAVAKDSFAEDSKESVSADTPEATRCPTCLRHLDSCEYCAPASSVRGGE